MANPYTNLTAQVLYGNKAAQEEIQEILTPPEIKERLEAVGAEIESISQASGKLFELKSGTVSSVAEVIDETIRELGDLSRTLRNKVLPAIKAGYEEFQPNPAWTKGLIADPRRYRNLWKKACVTNVALFLAFFLELIFNSNFQEFEGYTTALVLITIAAWFGSNGGLLILWEKNNQALNQELWHGPEFYCLKSPVPQQALDALEKAKQTGLFDYFRVVAPREAFEIKYQGDPVIIGYAGGRSFLIVQFDLGEDLKSA